MGSDTQEENTAGNNEAAVGGEEMPEPDLEGIPDVVAEVNGEEIHKEDFEAAFAGQYQQAAMQAQMMGQPVDEEMIKEQVLESMVGMELLIQEAENSGFEATEEEKEELLENIAEQNGLSRDEFLAALEEQGMDEEEVMSQLETQVKIDQLIARETGDIEPTDEELEEAYDMMVEQQEAMAEEGEETDIPSFEEIKPQLEEQLKAQKQSEATQMLVEELREDADVTIHL